MTTLNPYQLLSQVIAQWLQHQVRFEKKMIEFIKMVLSIPK